MKLDVLFNFKIIYDLFYIKFWNNICKDTIRDEPTSVGFVHEKAQTMSFVEHGFERLGPSHQMVGFSR